MTGESGPTRSETTLSEADSRRLLQSFGVPVVDDVLVRSAGEAIDAANSIGYPLVAKLCGPSITHNAQRGLVHLRLADEKSARAAVEDLLAAARPEDGEVAILLAPMLFG